MDSQIDGPNVVVWGGMGEWQGINGDGGIGGGGAACISIIECQNGTMQDSEKPYIYTFAKQLQGRVQRKPPTSPPTQLAQ